VVNSGGHLVTGITMDGRGPHSGDRGRGRPDTTSRFGDKKDSNCAALMDQAESDAGIKQSDIAPQ